MERLVGRIAGFTAATRSGLPPVWVVHLVGDAHQYMRGLTDRRGIVEAFAVDKGRNNIYQRGVIAEIYNQPVAANDHVLPKPQWSAFVNTTLHSHLQARGVDTLLLSGVFMDQCITSTARDAVQAGYDVYVMKDLSQACEGTVDEWGDILADEGIAPVTAQAVARLLPSQGRPVMPQPLRRCAP
jgi:nicotinamidase-related amidase